MLFNEPKLLKFYRKFTAFRRLQGFSALQRAEIAEIRCGRVQRCPDRRFSALQRAEIAEIDLGGWRVLAAS